MFNYSASQFFFYSNYINMLSALVRIAQCKVELIEKISFFFSDLFVYNCLIIPRSHRNNAR